MLAKAVKITASLLLPLALPITMVGLVAGLVLSAASEASADVGDAGSSPITGLARDAGARALGDAGAPHDAGAPISKTPPDPPAMSERQQWVFDLRWERGDIYLLGVHKVDMGAAHQTPRVMGRFALELFEGPTVIERVRFDFPMLGVPMAPDAGMKTPARFEPKLKTRIGVLFPATKRGTKLELWDRATNERMALPWPPTEGPVTEDAGLSGARP